MDAIKGTLNRKKILETALMLADRGGAEQLSMRRLAAELGVQAMSLYNHVANKEDILNGLVELVVAEITVPDTKSEWKTAMRERAISAHRALRRHPWAIRLLLTRSTAGPAMLAYVDATIGCLIEAGFSYEQADHIWNAMDNHIYGFTLQEVNFPFESDSYADAAREFMPAVSREQYPYFTELATLIMEKRYSGIHDLSFGLDLILDSLENLLDTG